MKHLPHLTFLRSFEAAARHLSFTAASEELNCTQSAVSNHVRSLEEYIGRPLFVRLPRALVASGGATSPRTGTYGYSPVCVRFCRLL